MATGESGGSTMLASGLATLLVAKEAKKGRHFAHQAFHSPHDFVEQQRRCHNLLMFTGSTFRTLRYDKMQFLQMLFVCGCCSAHVCQNPSLPLWTLGHSDESLAQSRSITAKVGR